MSAPATTEGISDFIWFSCRSFLNQWCIINILPFFVWILGGFEVGWPVFTVFPKRLSHNWLFEVDIWKMGPSPISLSCRGQLGGWWGGEWQLGATSPQEMGPKTTPQRFCHFRRFPCFGNVALEGLPDFHDKKGAQQVKVLQAMTSKHCHHLLPVPERHWQHIWPISCFTSYWNVIGSCTPSASKCHGCVVWETSPRFQENPFAQQPQLQSVRELSGLGV